MEEKWWQRSVVYQIYPRSFQDSNGDGIGDLAGITKRLPYIAELGADVIWLSPVYASPNDDNGYDISDYRAIMSEFGTMEDFDRMLETAHRLGLRIVMDLVVNHTSDEHRWFRESRKSKDSPYRGYYIWRDGKNGGAPSNQGSCFGGSAWEYDGTTGQYYLHLFSKKQPDLNWDNPKVRDEVFDMMDWWLKKGVDGFRMDVISLLSKDPSFPDGDAGVGGYTGFAAAANGPHEHEYLREMNRRVLSKYDLMTVGECPGVSPVDARQYANLDGTELSMVFQFDHMAVDIDPELGRYGAVVPLNLVKLKQAMASWETTLEGYAWNSLYWDNHDQPRIVSRWGNDSAEYRALSAKMLAACLHMMKGTPYIFQGEELGMTNYPWTSISQINDIESKGNSQVLVDKGILTEEERMRVMRAQSRDNARTPMQWDSTPNAGFTAGTPWLPVNPNCAEINAEAEVKDPDSVFSFYKKLISYRKQSDLVVHGSFELLEADNPALFVYKRKLKNEKMLVICNFTDRTVDFHIPEDFAGYEVKIDNYPETDAKSPEIRPYEARVLAGAS